MTEFTRESANRVARATQWVEARRREPAETPRTVSAPRFAPHEHVHFELAEALSVGGTATAYRRTRNADGTLVTRTDLPTITVSDEALSKYYGDAGDYGLAIKFFDTSVYDVTDMQCP